MGTIHVSKGEAVCSRAPCKALSLTREGGAHEFCRASGHQAQLCCLSVLACHLGLSAQPAEDGMWPLLASSEEPELQVAPGGQQPHRFLGRGQQGRGREARGGAAIPSALGAAVLGGEARAENGPGADQEREWGKQAVLALAVMEAIAFTIGSMVLCSDCVAKTAEVTLQRLSSGSRPSMFPPLHPHRAG